MKKVVNVALSLGAFLAGVILSSCGAAPMFDCGKSLKFRAPSPDGAHIAGVLLVQCGATTSDAIWVLLANRDEKFDYERDKIAVFEGKNVDVAWRGDGLVVSYKDSRPFRTDAISRGVSVTYEKIPAR
jgi:hypothetical protein